MNLKVLDGKTPGDEGQEKGDPTPSIGERSCRKLENTNILWWECDDRKEHKLCQRWECSSEYLPVFHLPPIGRACKGRTCYLRGINMTNWPYSKFTIKTFLMRSSHTYLYDHHLFISMWEPISSWNPCRGVKESEAAWMSNHFLLLHLFKSDLDGILGKGILNNNSTDRKGLATFTQLVKVRGVNLVWALPSIRFSWNFYQIISGTNYE